jgi:hypothetical protein
VLIVVAIIAFFALVVIDARAAESSALGIKPNDQAFARENTRRVEACRTSIRFSGAKFFFETPVHYHPNGGKLTGEGGGGLCSAEDTATTDNNPCHQIATRFVPSNPRLIGIFWCSVGHAKRSAAFRFTGAGTPLPAYRPPARVPELA